MRNARTAVRVGQGLLLAVLLVCAGAVHAGPAAVPDKADVRVLIDISGSMRQNDPDNLRRPALRMLAGLLQPGTRAGVWTFARWVNNLQPVAEVDEAWKRRTRSLSEQITSPGQFTNIEEVLEKASADWEGAPGSHARHLVLLTDGMVDVSKDAAENAASRARILDKLLPRLKAAGVKVHTIALSERADHDLMKRLAGVSGGWYQQVAQADALQRAFLKMFETVGKPDAVPLEDNRFVVDSTISEATVLVFSKPGAEPVVLQAPDGQRYSDSDLPGGVAWSRDAGYDLITIASPAKGEWRLEADLDPDNRVLIVTDLKLQTSELPSHVAAGETTQVEAYLSNKQQLVSRAAFLRLLEVRAEAVREGKRRMLPLNDQAESGDAKAADGRYSMRYGEVEAADEIELLIAVDSPTFMREKRFRLVAHEPLSGVIADGADGPLLTLQSEVAVMQPDVTVDAWQQAEGGARIPLELVEQTPAQWRAALSDATSPVYAQIRGTTRLGNLIERTIGPLSPPGAPAVKAAIDPPPEAAPVPQPDLSAAAEEAALPEQRAEPVKADEEIPQESESWVMPAILFGAFNLLLLLGGGAWFFIQRRKSAAADDLGFDDLLDEPLAGAESAEVEKGEGVK